MNVKVVFSAAVGLFLSVCSASAQSTLKEIWKTDPRIISAAGVARQVMETVALAIVGIDLCKVGDPGPWYDVMATVDARHAFCVAQDKKWIALTYPLGKETEEARKAGLSNTVGTLLFLRAVAARASRANEEGKTFCTRQPWKMLLDPDKANAAEVDALRRAEPDAQIDLALALMKSVRKLGNDSSFVEAPCDQNFWPASFVLKK